MNQIPKPTGDCRSSWREMLARAREGAPGSTLLALVDSALASPNDLPALPRLARLHSERLAERVRDPRQFAPDGSADARQHLEQWSAWYARVSERLEHDGTDLLAELYEAAPGDTRRIQALAERVTTLVAELRQLGMPWWPLHKISGQQHFDLPDWCERVVGRIDTRAIRQGQLGDWAETGDPFGGL